MKEEGIDDGSKLLTVGGELGGGGGTVLQVVGRWRVADGWESGWLKLSIGERSETRI